MSPCDALVRDASSGVAASLRAVDCVSAEATSSAFTRLFGTHGALLPALTVLLTLYVGLFALLLLTGRARLSIGSLTPRMITLGLVLTFVTSSVAYQGVVWNLAVGAPDQIAGALVGSSGSATQMFADRIDILFNAIADTARNTTAPGPARGAGGSFSPENLMWLGALLLMLGTVGVLVTARIALAVLLAVGPIFICLVLFNGARGLFAGWLRAVALTALTPLFAVLGGVLMTQLALPVVSALAGPEGVDGRAAMALFVLAFVHCALMALAIRVASTMVSGWRPFAASRREKAGSVSAVAPSPAVAGMPFGAAHAATTPRVQAMIAGMSAAGGVPPAGPAASGATVTHRTHNIASHAASGAAASRPSDRLRSRGIGSRFATPAASARKRLP